MMSTPTKECSAQEFFMDAIPDYAKCVAERNRLREALFYIALSTRPDGQWANQAVCSFARAALGDA